ncbi:MAG TPA: hypothetical protein VKU19_25250 [Bryobacteraceae bacterium]|nr:hypothetical protein [Bryobacteraceae bacterium]
MKKAVFRFGVLVAVAVAGYFFTDRIFVLRHRAVFDAGTVKAASAPVVPRTVEGLENGEIRVIHSVRGDGAYSSMRTVVRQDGAFLIGDIHYIKEASVVTVLGDIKATHTFYPSPTAPSARGLNLLDPATNCTQPFAGSTSLASTIVGNDEMLGYRVLHIKHAVNGPGPVLEEWLAPDLGCEELKMTLDGTVNGREMHSERHAVRISLGEPDSSLFTIPQGYSEMAPDQADQAFAEKYENGKVDSRALHTQNRRSLRYAQFGPNGQFAPKH